MPILGATLSAPSVPRPSIVLSRVGQTVHWALKGTREATRGARTSKLRPWPFRKCHQHPWRSLCELDRGEFAFRHHGAPTDHAVSIEPHPTVHSRTLTHLSLPRHLCITIKAAIAVPPKETPYR
jgi:hypothetical protein